VAIYLEEALKRNPRSLAAPTWTKFESQRSALLLIRDPWFYVPFESSFRRLKQVEGVVCSKLNGSNICTLHLTAHHLIFRYEDDTMDEMWVSLVKITYVMPAELTNRAWGCASVVNRSRTP
jgi:hypothetical protein